MAGKLEVYCGGMFAGKSTELQRQGRRQELAGRSVVYLKPSVDVRDGLNESKTHEGRKVNAVTVQTDLETSYTANTLKMDAVNAADVVCIDEIQFFPVAFIRQIEALIKLGKIVYVAGLDMTKWGEPFMITCKLMARAEVVKKFSAVCSVCGGDAWVSVEVNQKEGVFNVGNDYVPMCRTCANNYWGGYNNEQQ